MNNLKDITFPETPNAGQDRELTTVSVHWEPPIEGNVVKQLLSRLRPGESCGKHVDKWTPGRRRFHIPIETNQKAVFCYEDDCFHIPQGEIFEVFPDVPHWVENNGTTDRIHWIIDLAPE